MSNKNTKTMQNTETKHIPKQIRVNLPEQENLSQAWYQAKQESRGTIKSWGHNPDEWPEGAKTRSTKIESLEYFICEIGGGRHERAGFNEPFYTDHTTPDRQYIAELAETAMENPICAKEGFQIDVEAQFYFHYYDEDGELCPTDYGQDEEPTGEYVNITAYTYKPVKATDENIRLIQAYQHFLFYIDLNHLIAHDPWKESGLCKHFIEKLQGFYRRESSEGGPNLIDLYSIVKWVQEMTDHNQKALFDYILIYHIDRY